MDKKSQAFEPKIVAFLCRWCSYAGADLAGVSRLEYPANVVPLRVNCSGRVDAEMVLTALERGADGVLIGGCHPGDCHYVSGNYKTRRRVILLKQALSEVGIDPRPSTWNGSARPRGSSSRPRCDRTRS